MTRTYESIYNDGWQRDSSLEINLQMRVLYPQLSVASKIRNGYHTRLYK